MPFLCQNVAGKVCTFTPRNSALSLCDKQARLSLFRHWYYLPEYDRFGPSKYIGYRDMDFETYELNFAKRMDGGRSEKALAKWFELLSPDRTVWQSLHDKLNEFVESQGKHLNSAAVIHIPMGCSDADILNGWSERMRERALQRYVRSFLAEEISSRAHAVSHFNKKNPSDPIKTSAARYRRDPFITEYAKIQANGICQLCEQPAPFHDPDGHPYLETHHIVWLSKGGLDTIDNTVALCANCHRKMHVLNLQEDREKLQRQVSEFQYVSRSRC